MKPILSSDQATQLLEAANHRPHSFVFANNIHMTYLREAKDTNAPNGAAEAASNYIIITEAQRRGVAAEVLDNLGYAGGSLDPMAD